MHLKALCSASPCLAGEPKQPDPGANRIMRIMKLIAVIMLSACLGASANGFSQGVTLTAKNAPLGKILKEIKKQTNYVFFYNYDLLEKANKITVDVRNVSLEEVLDICFKDQPLGYVIENHTVIITEKTNPDAGKTDEHELPAPPGVVRGRVVYENNEPVPGINVTVKGSLNATATDANGYYTLKNVDKNATLVFSSVNIEQLEIKLNGREELNISVKARVGKLDEVQIIGYGTTTRRLNTGNISTVKAGEIATQPVSNPLLTLQGKVPGLFIQSSSGLPGSSVTIQLQGRNSIAAGTLPLYVIDGVPFTNTTLDQTTPSHRRLDPLNNINPADIESIEILKDADATAIFGSRAANGVILITTKKGKSGKTSFETNVYRGFGNVSNYIDMLSTPDYVRMRRTALQLDGITPNASNAPDLVEWDSVHTTNWQKLLLGGTADITNIQVGLSGGSAQTRFMVSGGYRKEGYVYPGNHSDKRMNGRLSLDHSSADKKFNLNMTASYSVDRNDIIAYDLVTYANLPPNLPLYDSTGELYWGGGKTNPLSQILNKADSRTNNFISNALLKYNLLPHLDLRLSSGYTQTDIYQVTTFPKALRNPNSTTMSYSTFANNHINTWIVEPQLHYMRQVKRSRWTLMAGVTWQQTLTNGNLINANNYTSDDLLENLASAGTITIQSANYAKYRYNSWFGRINYVMRDRYIFNINYRRDGSSRFGAGNKWGDFGSVGAGWVFSAEPFVNRHLPWLSFGKLRASYGLTGNDQIPDYEFIPTYRSTQYTYQASGLYPFRIGNTAYSWETNRKLEGGIDAGLFHDKILFTVNYYYNRSGNQLVNYPLAGQTGFGSYRANLPAIVVNKGWEISLTSSNYKTKNWEWTSSFNLTLPQNKLVSFERLEASSYGSANLVIGQPLNLVWGLHFTGVNPATGAPVFADLDGSGNINYPADYVYMRSSLPRYYGGFSNTIRYGRFELEILFNFVNKTSPGLLYSWYRSAGTSNNVSSYIWNNSWKKPGDNASLPRPSSAGAGANDYLNFIQSDAEALRDASYLRLNNLQLSYRLDAKWLQKISMESCNFFIQGRNLFTITSYEGFDPEIFNAISQPMLRVLTVGINCKF